MALSPDQISQAVGFFTNQTATSRATVQGALGAGQDALARVNKTLAAPAAAVATKAAKDAGLNKSQSGGATSGFDPFKQTAWGSNARLTQNGWLNPVGMLLGSKFTHDNGSGSTSSSINDDMGVAPKDSAGTPRNATQWLLNAMSTGGYISGELAKNIGDNIHTGLVDQGNIDAGKRPDYTPAEVGSHLLNTVFGPVAATGKGIAEGFGARFNGKRPVTMDQNLETIGASDGIRAGAKAVGLPKQGQDIAAGVGGFVADVATDPTSYITGGAGALKYLGGATKGLSDAVKVNKAAALAGTDGVNVLSAANKAGKLRAAEPMLPKATNADRAGMPTITVADQVAKDAADRAAALDTPTSVHELPTAPKGAPVDIPKLVDPVLTPKEVPLPHESVKLPTESKLPAVITPATMVDHPNLAKVNALLPDLSTMGRKVDGLKILKEANVVPKMGAAVAAREVGMITPEVSAQIHAITSSGHLPDAMSGLKDLGAGAAGRTLLASTVPVLAADGKKTSTMALGPLLERLVTRQATGADAGVEQRALRDFIGANSGDAVTAAPAAARMSTNVGSLAESVGQNVPELGKLGGPVDIPSLLVQMKPLTNPKRAALLQQTLGMAPTKFANFGKAIDAATNGQVEASAMRSMVDALGIKTQAKRADTLRGVLSKSGHPTWEQIQKGVPTSQEVLDTHGIPAETAGAAKLVDVEAEKVGAANEAADALGTMSPLTAGAAKAGITALRDGAKPNKAGFVDTFGDQQYGKVWAAVMRHVALPANANMVHDAATGLSRAATPLERGQFVMQHAMDALRHVEQVGLSEGRVPRLEALKDSTPFFVGLPSIVGHLSEETALKAFFDLDHRLAKAGEGYGRDAAGRAVQNVAFKDGLTLYPNFAARGAKAASNGADESAVYDLMMKFPNAFMKTPEGMAAVGNVARELTSGGVPAALKAEHLSNQVLATANSMRAADDLVNPHATEIITAIAAGGDRSAIIRAVTKASKAVDNAAEPGDVSLTQDIASQRIHNGSVNGLGEAGVALAKRDARLAGPREGTARFPKGGGLTAERNAGAEAATEFAKDAQGLIDQGVELGVQAGHFEDSEYGRLLGRMEMHTDLGKAGAISKIAFHMNGMHGQGALGVERVGFTEGAHRLVGEYQQRMASWLHGGKYTEGAYAPMAGRIQQALGLTAAPTAEAVTNHVRDMWGALATATGRAEATGKQLTDAELQAALTRGADVNPALNGFPEARAPMEPGMIPIAMELYGHIQHVEGLPARMGVNAKDVMREMERYSSRHGGSDADLLNAKAPLAEQAKFWQTADPGIMDNPAQSLTNFHTAMVASTIKPSIGASASTLFDHVADGLTREQALAKGYKPLNTTTEQGIGAYVNPKSLFSPDALAKMSWTDATLKSLESVPQGLLKAALQWSDRALTILKMSMTIYNPSHHVTNFLGNSGAILNEGVDLRNGVRAMKALHAGGAIEDPAAGITAALQDAGKVPGRFTSDTVTPIIGKNGVQYSMREVSDLFKRIGVDITPHMAVDTLDAFGSVKPSVYDTIAHSKLNPLAHTTKGLSKMSAALDNTTRYTHAIHVMESRQFATVKEMENAVAAAVQHSHPTGAQFSAFERNGVRRVLTFYTWQRLALGRVAQLAIERPAVITAPSKYQYNQAEAAGFKPESFGKPFGADPRIASYESDGAYGPTFTGGYSPLGGSGDLPAGEAPHQWGLSLSSPQLDTLMTLFQGANVGDGSAPGSGMFTNLLSSMNPLLTTIPEYGLNSMPGGIGKKPQDDPAGFLLSKTGAPERILKAIGARPKTTVSGNPSNSAEQQAGENQRQLLNYLTGLKFTDYTNQTSAKFAANTQGKEETARLKALGWDKAAIARQKKLDKLSP